VTRERTVDQLDVRVYNDLLAPARRKKNPAEVRILTGDYRANRQHWVTVTRIEGYPQVARVRAVASADRIDVETAHVRAFELDLAQAPIASGGSLRIVVNGQEVCSGTRATLGDVAKLVLADGSFKTGSPDAAAFEKKPKLSGPITDWLQFRLAGNWDKQTKGWFDNVSTAPTAKDEGGVIDTTFFEGQLQAKFSDRFETWLKVSLIHWDNGGGGPGSRSSWAPFPWLPEEPRALGFEQILTLADHALYLAKRPGRDHIRGYLFG